MNRTNIVTFGKHKGLTFEELKEHKSYCNWVVNLAHNPARQLATLREYLMLDSLPKTLGFPPLPLAWAFSPSSSVSI